MENNYSKYSSQEAITHKDDVSLDEAVLVSVG
jgi:hypothetical protein